MDELVAVDDFKRTIEWPDPTEEELRSPLFEVIWQAIKTWDINVPSAYSGYCGATGNHAVAIVHAIERNLLNENLKRLVKQFQANEHHGEEISMAAGRRQARLQRAIVEPSPYVTFCDKDHPWDPLKHPIAQWTVIHRDEVDIVVDGKPMLGCPHCSARWSKDRS